MEENNQEIQEQDQTTEALLEPTPYRNKYKQGTRDVAIFMDRGKSDERISLSFFNDVINFILLCIF